MLVDPLQKQEGRDARGRFLKGRCGNSEGRFRKGRSGNPKARPPGARNKATEIAEILLDGEAEALTRRAVELALAGEATALRLCLERIIPPRRGRPVQLGLPPVRNARRSRRHDGGHYHRGRFWRDHARRGGRAGPGGPDFCPGGRDQRFRAAAETAGRGSCYACVMLSDFLPRAAVGASIRNVPIAVELT